MPNQYKSKYAKANASTKTFFIGVISVTAVFVILILFAVFQPFKIRDYSGMNRINALEIFEIEETNYYVYFYSPTCGGCVEVKPDILNYANFSRNGKEGRVQIYVVNMASLVNNVIIKDCSTSSDQNCQTTNIFPSGSTDISAIKVATTPSMIKISNGRVASTNWTTVSSIKTELSNAIDAATSASDSVLYYNPKFRLTI